MGKTITIINEKGGVGKSTTAINLAAGISLRESSLHPQNKFSVLVIDLDPSTVTTLSSIHSKRFETSNPEASVVGLFKLDIPQTVTPEYLNEIKRTFLRQSEMHNNLWFIPTHKITMRKFIDVELQQLRSREIRLQRAVKLFSQMFSYIIIDTPPEATDIADNAILAADCILMPTLGDTNSYHGMMESISRVQTLRKDFQKEIPIIGIVPTDIKDEATAREVVAQISELYPNGILQTIHHSADIPACHAQGLDIFSYRPAKNGVEWANESFRSVREYALLVENVLRELDRPTIRNIVPFSNN
ncbi:MAG: ParA family protein [Anaerolineaceae bacterium]